MTSQEYTPPTPRPKQKIVYIYIAGIMQMYHLQTDASNANIDVNGPVARVYSHETEYLSICDMKCQLICMKYGFIFPLS